MPSKTTTFHRTSSPNDLLSESWSNPAVWSNGIPVDGDTVVVSSDSLAGDGSIDNLPGLHHLTALTLQGNAQAVVEDGNLTIDTVDVVDGFAGDFGLSVVNGDEDTLPTLTVGAVVSAGLSYTVYGATFINRSAVDAGGSYELGQDDFGHQAAVELSAAPSSSSSFTFDDPDTLALFQPAASNACALVDLDTGDVLELPGSAVTAVNFGTSSLTITTTAGAYAFTNVTYVTDNGEGGPNPHPITGYTAAVDPTTGLVAVTFTSGGGPDIFEQNVKTTSGLFSGYYAWSNPANWSQGLPVDGSNVVFATKGTPSYDDIAALSLGTLNLNDSTVLVTVGSLAVGSLQGDATPGNDGFLYADAQDAGAPVTVTVGAATGAGLYLDADGAGATLLDQAAADPGNATYTAEHGGLLELAAAPASTSQLFSPRSSGGTIALPNAAATTGALLDDPAPGDTLELPGTAVASVTFGATSLSVTTDAGTYAFTNVAYAPTTPVTGYTARRDAATGLVAITFTGPDVFEQNVRATSGPLAGKYLWSNPANWSQGLPVNGGSVAVADPAGTSYDDLPSLSLASLTLNHSMIEVTGSSLSIGTVVGGALFGPAIYFGFLGADAGDAGAPVTVTVGAITGTRSTYFAAGAGATFVDNSVADPGDTYEADDSGLFEFKGVPADTGNAATDSDFWYEYGGRHAGTIAIARPTPVTTSDIGFFGVGDTIELPGTQARGLAFNAGATLTLTTDAGSYQFAYQGLYGTITGYTAKPDSDTGLVAITFVGLDTFEQNVKATSGPFAGKYLWSNPANWSAGVPIAGDGVVVADQAAVGYDDLPSLSLASLSLYGSDVYVVGSSLTVGTVTGGGHLAANGTSFLGTLTADAAEAGSPVTVTVDTIADTSIYHDTYLASGTGATFIDRSATDLGQRYNALNGGVFELNPTPVSTSTLSFNVTIVDQVVSGPSTLALKDPGETVAAVLDDVEPGDVLELPGTAVTAVSIGASSLTATTDAGTYAFPSVGYRFPVTGYSAAPDAATGLVAITFTGPDVFEENVKATSGPLNGYYLWSNAANWSQGLPADGSSVSVRSNHGVDDVAAVTLANLDLGGQLYVEGSNLSAATVTADGGDLVVGLLLPNPATVTLGAVTGGSLATFSDGPGARLIDRSTTQPLGLQEVYQDGFSEFAAAPSATSDLAYNQGGTIALDNPAASDAGILGGVEPGDVLELPGTSVSGVTFGTTSFSVATDAGTYAFTNVTYASRVGSYTASFDAVTGLVAVTFGAPPPDRFVGNVANAAGDYLWSNPANWSAGIPVAGDSAIIGSAPGIVFNDLPNLTLSSLTVEGLPGLISDAAHLTITGTLSIDAGTLTLPAGVEVTAGSVAVGAGGHVALAGGVLDPPVPVAVDAGGQIGGTGTIVGTVNDQGTLEASGGLLQVQGAVSGAGALVIDANASLELEGGAALTPGGTIRFAGTGGTLLLDAGQSLTGTLLGFRSGDVIDVAGQSVRASYVQGILTLMAGSTLVGSLAVGEATASEAFTAQPDGQGGTDITLQAPAGTATGDVHIVTLDGLHYDFQADGDFTLERSTQAGNPFDIQIRTTPWAANNLASLATKAAAQVGAHVIGFTLDGPPTIDGIPATELGVAHPVQHLSGGTLTALGADGYRLDWAGGESLTVANRGFYLDLSVSVPTSDGPGSVQGLLGSLTGQANDLSLPDGSVLPQPVPDATLLGVFADAWRVMPDASILDGGSLRPDLLGLPASPGLLVADAPGELLTGTLGSASASGTLFAGTWESLAGDPITNFGPHDLIDVTDGASFTAAYQSMPDGGRLSITDGAHSTSLTLIGPGASATMMQTSDTHGGTLFRVGPV